MISNALTRERRKNQKGKGKREDYGLIREGRRARRLELRLAVAITKL